MAFCGPWNDNNDEDDDHDDMDTTTREAGCSLSFALEDGTFTTALTNFPAALPRPLYRCQQLSHEFVMRRYHARVWRAR